MIRYSTIRDFLFQERDRIHNLGGVKIPASGIEAFMSRCELVTAFKEPSLIEQELRTFLKPYELSIPAKWAEHCTKLKTAALKSSRLIRLRQRRGLPFKSRRQP